MTATPQREAASAGARGQSIQVNVCGREVAFVFPGQPFEAQSNQKILTGKEYRVYRPPGYTPKAIVDVGANSGAFAVLMAGAFATTPIYCFEPSPINAPFLRKNAATMGRIQVFEYGLLDRAGEAKLYHGAPNTLCGSLHENAMTGRTYDLVRTERASAEFKRLGLTDVSILKLDTEGCELAILRDIADWLERVDFLYLEYHSESDRRAMDRMLEAYFFLTACHADGAHNGVLTYAANRLGEKHPAIHRFRIEHVDESLIRDAEAPGCTEI